MIVSLKTTEKVMVALSKVTSQVTIKGHFVLGDILGNNVRRKIL